MVAHESSKMKKVRLGNRVYLYNQFRCDLFMLNVLGYRCSTRIREYHWLAPYFPRRGYFDLDLAEHTTIKG